MAFLQKIEEYNFDEDNEFSYTNYENNENKILELWKQLIKLINNYDIYDCRNISPGEIGIFDKKDKCKDLNLIIYDSNNNQYIFDWYGTISPEKIWCKYDDIIGYWELDPNPVPKFVEHIKIHLPSSITIIK